MKPKTMVMLLVAVGCGVLAAVGSTLLGPRANQEEKVKVLVTKTEINFGDAVNKDLNQQFQWKEYPKNLVPKGAITDQKKVENKVVVRKLLADEVIKESDVSDTAGPPLKEGERLYTIGVNAEKAVAGFILPGSRVDIISVRKNGNRSTVRYILQNVQVAAINQIYQEGGGQNTKQQAIIPAHVTLRCSPSDCMVLAQYKDTSTLSLALRPKDVTSTETIQDIEEDEDVEILVATDDIDANTVLEEPELLVKKKMVPKDKEPDGALHDMKLLQGKTLKNLVPKDKPITAKDFLVKKAEPEEKPVVIKTAAPAPKLYSMIIINGSTSEEKTFREKPAKGDRIPSPPAPINDGSDGKP